MLYAIFDKIIGLSIGSGMYQFNNSDTDELVEVFYYKPKRFNANTPVVIILTGEFLNAETYRDDWQKLAEIHNLMVLVPLFSNSTYRDTNGYNLGNVFVAFNEGEIDGYGSSGIENPVAKWSFALPDRVFADFKQREITNQPGYTLYGHGAGGQFATRFALMMPYNHACCVIAANPGWYTYLNRSIAWPYGLGNVNWVSDAEIDHYLQSPFILMLGDDDTENDGIVRLTNEAAAQGKSRKVRGQQFFNNAQALAKNHKVTLAWQLVYVPHANHSNIEMAPSAASYITQCI